MNDPIPRYEYGTTCISAAVSAYAGRPVAAFWGEDGALFACKLEDMRKYDNCPPKVYSLDWDDSLSEKDNLDRAARRAYEAFIGD
jgi:hypothetical protein